MTSASLLVVQVIFIIADFSFFVFSIVGNAVVIYVISRDKKLKSKSNYHILSVAAADLLIGLIGIPLGVTAGLTGAPHDFLPCLALNSFLLSVFAVSMFSLLAVSVDRCWAVCFPVTYHVRSTTTTKIIIAFCWIFGIFFGYLPTMGWNTKEFWNGKCDLRVIADFNYLLVGVGIALISSLSIIALYLIIYCVILKQARKRQSIVANSPIELKKHRYEIRAANTLAMIVATFIILWMPGNISLFIISTTGNRDFPLDILELSTILVHLNAAIDPLIYAYRMKNIREALNKFFNCFKRKSAIESSSSSSEKRSSRTSRSTTKIENT